MRKHGRQLAIDAYRPICLHALIRAITRVHSVRQKATQRAAQEIFYALQRTATT